MIAPRATRDTLYEGQETDSDWNFAELYKKLPDGSLWVDVYSDIGEPETSQEVVTAAGCGIGEIVEAGETCRYEGAGNNFTFTVRETMDGVVMELTFAQTVQSL